MKFEQAQATLRQILARISSNSTAGELLQAQRDLDTLLEALRAKEGLDSIRAAIAAVYDQLVGQITQSVLDDLRSRDEAFQRANAALSLIAQKAEQSAATLALEKTRIVLPALNTSIEEIKDLLAALKRGDQVGATRQAEALWALLEQVKAKITEI
jgi:hypothetical protein